MATTFDPGKVADLAGQIAAMQKEVHELRMKKDAAYSACNRAETALLNLQAAFTDACRPNIDMMRLPHRPTPGATA